MMLYTRFKKLQAAVPVLGAAMMFIPGLAHSAVPASWCTHSTAQRLEGDVNGDGRLDAVCHDKVSGTKWVALAEATGLEQRWYNDTLRWCSHAGATLHIGDVNGDRRADLVCKDPGRVWVDYAFVGGDFYAGTDYYRDTTWCTHPGALTFVGDQNRDGRADLVCRGSDGYVWIDWADPKGQFEKTDAEGLGPDFELLDIIRSPGGYFLQIRNNGIAGRAEYFRCSTSSYPLANVLRIPAGQTRAQFFSDTSNPEVVTCSVEGRGEYGAPELFISNNQLRKRMR